MRAAIKDSGNKITGNKALQMKTYPKKNNQEK